MEKALKVLQSGGVILYPTDTIWGLGCNALDEKAIQRIYEIKKRDVNQSFIILVESEKRLMDLVEVPQIAWDLIDLAEKPITLIYDHPKGLPSSLLAQDGSIGIRLVKKPYLVQLISKLNAPLVSTSANFSGEKSPLSFSDISTELTAQVDYSEESERDHKSIYPGSSIIRVWSDGRIKVIRE